MRSTCCLPSQPRMLSSASDSADFEMSRSRLCPVSTGSSQSFADASNAVFDRLSTPAKVARWRKAVAASDQGSSSSPPSTTTVINACAACFCDLGNLPSRQHDRPKPTPHSCFDAVSALSYRTSVTVSIRSAKQCQNLCLGQVLPPTISARRMQHPAHQLRPATRHSTAVMQRPAEVRGPSRSTSSRLWHRGAWQCGQGKP